MSSLLQLRTRLKTIRSLNSIFSALEVVTVVRTRRVREPYQMMERYLQPLKEVLAGRVREAQDGAESPGRDHFQPGAMRLVQ